jgi:hypothetical protein
MVQARSQSVLSDNVPLLVADFTDLDLSTVNTLGIHPDCLGAVA